MSHPMTLTLPDPLYEPIRRIAQATNRPLEEVVLTALRASLPPLDGLPPEIADELVRLEELDDGALEELLYQTAPPAEQEEIEDLLEQSQAGTLTDAERGRLLALREGADRVMLRKARAAVLLRFRGRHVPTTAELRERSAPAK